MAIVQDEISLVKVSNGKGVKDSKPYYQVSTNGQDVPQGNWLENIPKIPEGQYLWTKTEFVFDDDSTSVSYSVSRNGTNGDGVGIANTDVEYKASINGTTPPAGNWSTSIPPIESNQYLWTRTTITYTDNETSVSYSVGGKGVDGSDAQLLYLTADAEQMAFDTNNVVKAQVITITAKLQNIFGNVTFEAVPYINNTAQTAITLGGSGNIRTLASNQWTNPNWTLVAITATLGNLTDTLSIVKVKDGDKGEQGQTGPTGAQGPQGPAGQKGDPGNAGPTGPKGEDATEPFSGYLTQEAIVLPANPQGVVSDFSKANGKFNTFEGNIGLSSGVTFTLVSQMGIACSINATGNYSVTAISAETGMAIFRATYKGIELEKILTVVKARQGTQGPQGQAGATGAAGAKGADGRGVQSTTVTYQASASGTATPSGSWVTNPPTVAANQFLWTRIVITYTDNTTTTAYSVGKMGAQGPTGATGSAGAAGAKGADGKGVRSSAITYQASSSGTSAPTGSWVANPPTVSANQFLWTRIIITYTDNATTTAYSVGKMGANGATGPTGAKGDRGATGATGPSGAKGDPTGITVSSTAPSASVRYNGMLWRDTSLNPPVLKRFNGSSWEVFLFYATNISADNLAAITAKLGNVEAGKVTNTGSYSQPGATINYTTSLAGMIEMVWKVSNTNQNGVFTIQPTGISSQSYADIAKNIRQWFWEIGSGGLAVGTGSTSRSDLVQSVVHPEGITLQDYRKNYGQVVLRYDDLMTISATTLNAGSGFSRYAESGASQPLAKRSVGRIITLSGAFKNNSAFTSSSSSVNIGKLPSWATPIDDQNFVVQGSGMNRFLLSVTKSGNINCARYGTTGFINVPAGAWLNISCVYSVA